MEKVAMLDAKLLEKVRQYIADNYVEEELEESALYNTSLFGVAFEAPIELTNLKDRIKETWQQAVFRLIDAKGYTDPDVYKRASISKQTFSKIRCDINYQPNKDTAIQMCIGLKLNLDEALDLMGKAGYTLSTAIKRDLAVKYFIENNKYKMDELNIVLDGLKLKLFPIN